MVGSLPQTLMVIVFLFLIQVTVQVLRSLNKAVTPTFGVLRFIDISLTLLFVTNPMMVLSVPNDVMLAFLSVAYLNDFIMFLRNTINNKTRRQNVFGLFLFHIRMGGHRHHHLPTLLLGMVPPPPLSLAVTVYVRWPVVYHPLRLRLVLRPFRVMSLCWWLWMCHHFPVAHCQSQKRCLMR